MTSTCSDLDRECRRQGWGDPVFVEEHDLFRFADGRSAFSGEQADWKPLTKEERLSEELY